MGKKSVRARLKISPKMFWQNELHDSRFLRNIDMRSGEIGAGRLEQGHWNRDIGARILHPASLDGHSWPFPPQAAIGPCFSTGRGVTPTETQGRLEQADWSRELRARILHPASLDGHSWPFPPQAVIGPCFSTGRGVTPTATLHPASLDGHSWPFPPQAVIGPCFSTGRGVTPTETQPAAARRLWRRAAAGWAREEKQRLHCVCPC
jgi:hypothetical protein